MWLGFLINLTNTKTGEKRQTCKSAEVHVSSIGDRNPYGNLDVAIGIATRVACASVASDDCPMKTWEAEVVQVFPLPPVSSD